MKTFQMMKQARLFQNILGIPRMIKKPGIFGKSRAFSKKALLFPENARLFRLKLRTQGLCHEMNIILDLENQISTVKSSNFVTLLGENFFFRTNFLRSPHNVFRRTTKSLSLFNMLTPILHTETLRVRQGMLLAISNRKNEFQYLNIDVKQVQN